MKYDMNGKVAIIIGGSGSTGSAVCRMLAADGAKVVAVGRTVRTLNRVVDEIRSQGGEAMAVTGDVKRASDMERVVEAAVKAYGSVDALVNCAGVRGRLEHRSPVQDYEDDLWNEVIATEMTGVYVAMKPVVRQMLAQGHGGAIVNVGSATGVTPLKHQCAFTAAKAGMFNFTKAAAMELGADQIRVNAVAAGETLNDELRAMIDSDPAIAGEMVSHTPAGRLAQPDEIAGLICFLVSDAAKFITGSIVSADGAWSSGYTRDF